MRKFIDIFLLTLLTVSAALAGPAPQGRGDRRDDHDDNAPVQAGYAVITPTGGTSTGLVAFATFGLRHGENIAAQAGVLAPGLTTNAFLVVDSSSRLSRDLGVAIVNPNSANVNLTLTLKKSDGTQLGTATLTVPARQQVSKFVKELFSTASLPSDFVGTLSLTSTGSQALPFSAIGLRFRGQNFSTIPVTSLSAVTTALPVLATGIGGNGAILLPQFAAGGGWATQIVVANSGTASATVRVDLFKSDGTPLSTTLNTTTANSFTNISIPAGGVVTLAPRDADGDDDF